MICITISRYLLSTLHRVQKLIATSDLDYVPGDRIVVCTRTGVGSALM
jgi:hypothetical protein